MGSPLSSISQLTEVSRFSGAAIAAGVVLTTTSMATSVTDPLTGHTYSFVADDGVTPELREVGQYHDGTWFVSNMLNGVLDPVRVGSITPVSVGIDVSHYNSPNNLDDPVATGGLRWMHGAMVNPWQGQSGRELRPLAFDSYYGTAAAAANMPYQHDLNVDPGATGGPLVLTEGSIVKAESLTTEGGHTASAADKTKLENFSILTVVPEIPAANSFRPSMRGTDKRSYWTADQINLPAHRTANTGDRPWTTTQIDAATARISYVQQVFAPYQEPSRRWNPGARGGGVDIYGDDWYTQFAYAFGTFYGDYTNAEIEDLIMATVQVGIDINGLLNDSGFYFPAQAHHAGRKGICFMAGLLLDNQNILDNCTFSLNPNHFGVDDHYCGEVSAPMIDVQPRYYKGAYPYKWPEETLGLAEWSTVFPEGHEDQVDTEEQVADSDLARRSYQVLSFDNGAMYQHLFAMIADPTGQYYNHAYFNFTDRYLAVRVGDRLDGLWNANGPTNGHFTGNWYSIDPSATTVQYFQNMRDLSAWPNYLEDMIPEALPKPQVSHTGTNAYLDVDFNTNNFQSPQDKHAAITGYDLRWTAYAGGADAVTSEDDPAYAGNFDWHVIENVTLPYQLSGVPRGLKVQVQLRMKNVNGPGPWLDDRKRQNYANQSTTFDVTQERTRYSTIFPVPDIAGFDQVPLNFGPPTAAPETLVTGQTATGGDGIWYDGPGTITAARQWEQSDDGATGWSDISGATSTTFLTTAAQENKFVRLTVQKTNDEGTSALAEGGGGVPVAPPVATPLAAGRPNGSPFDVGVALGGKRLLVLFATRSGSTPVSEGGDIGAYSFGTAERIYDDNDAGSPEVGLAYMFVVPGGETATEIDFNNSDNQTCVSIYELSEAMVLTDVDNSKSAGLTTTVDTVSGGAAFWLGRSSAWVNFVSSAALEQHADNPVQDEGDDPVEDPNDNFFAAAHALGVSTGTVSVTHSNAAASNTIAILLSLEPAA